MFLTIQKHVVLYNNNNSSKIASNNKSLRNTIGINEQNLTYSLTYFF